MAGKTISVVPLASAVPFVQDILGGVTDAASKIGFNLQVWENQGQPTQWAAGITNAINTKADLVQRGGRRSRGRAAPDRRGDRGRDQGQRRPLHRKHSQDPVPALTSHVPNDFAQVGVLGHRQDRGQGQGPGHRLGRDRSDRAAGRRDPQIEACPSINYQNVPVTEWATRIQSTVQSTLTADPSINYVLPIL